MGVGPGLHPLSLQAAGCHHLHYDQTEVIAVFKILGVTYQGDQRQPL